MHAKKIPVRTIALIALAASGAGLAAQIAADRCLVPPAIRDAVANELSGERAFLHVQMLAGNRDRQAAEYEGEFFETTYIKEQAALAGLSEVRVEFSPSRDTWDGEEGDLWMIEPVRKKIASFNQVPSCLASGSQSADVEAELVYIGLGRESDYAGRDVKGKVVLGSGSVGMAFMSGASQRGAAGALGTGSSGASSNAPGYTLDQVGWASVSAKPDSGGFGFNLSLRQFLELRGLLERGVKVVVRAHVRAKTYPGKMNVISARIPGSDPAAGDLLLVAHAFETIATPGANDNCTGVATLLEIGRTLARLIRDGAIPKPRRTIHFVWGNEISGSTAFMFKHPELQDTLIAALNFDMTGANTKTTDTYLRMKMTPDGRPSYLNDLIGSLLQFVDQSDIRSPQGANGQFNYRLCPLATITSGSDHSVFLAAGVPTMQFNYWPDNFYHSAEDRIVYVDPTELKRVGLTAGAAFAYLAAAGPAEAASLAWEAAAGGEKWIAEVARQAVRLLGDDPARIHEQRKAARIKIAGAFERAKGSVESVRTLARTPDVEARIKTLVTGLAENRDTALRRLDAVYRDRCAELKIKPAEVPPTDKERESARLVPRRLFKVYSEEALKRGGSGQRGGTGGATAQAPQAKPGAAPAAPAAKPAAPGPAPRLAGFASTSVNYFIDGRRSILEIYELVRAECGNLKIGSNESKYAYILGPEYPDVDLESVAAYIMGLEKSGVVEIVRSEAKGRGKGA